MVNDIRWYVRRGGKNRETIKAVLRTWINAMMPVTPHTAEELWEQSGFDGMVSEAQFPEFDASKFSAEAEYGEDLIRNIMSDSAQIIKVTGMQPGRVILYTAAAWKRKVMDNAVELLREGKLDIPGLTKRCMADEELRKNGKAVSDLAKKIASDHMRSSVDKVLPIAQTDEVALLTSAAAFMSEEIGSPVEVMDSDAEGLYDPKGKSKAAVPGRPAILIE
jgi:leucyl-tRNA synthetase